jgi:flagellar hook assembly protein FlgD
LYPNFPNPFATTTTIAFNLPVDAQTSVKVYDLNGKLVKIVKDETMQAGYNSLTMDASGMMPGTYRYIIQSGMVMRSGTLTVKK